MIKRLLYFSFFAGLLILAACAGPAAEQPSPDTAANPAANQSSTETGATPNLVVYRSPT